MSPLISSSGRYRHVVFVGPAPFRAAAVASGGTGAGRLVSRVAMPSPVGWRSRPEPLHLAAPEGDRFPACAFTLTPEEREFASWLFATAGLDICHYKTETLRRRLPACLRAARAESVAQARAILEGAPQLRRAALGTLVIGVTHFFRDGPFFSALKRHVLPALVARAEAAGSGPLRVWSAGCSSGAELYSVAMLLAEQGVLDRFELLGTDCRADAVERARSGVYDPACLAGVPRDLLDRYFSPAGPAGSRREAAPALRRTVRWRAGDLLTAPEPGTWDLVLCRNLAIYLQPEAASGLWQRLGASLRPGGFLAPGKAERPTGASGLTAVGPCLYQRVGMTGAVDAR